MTTSTLKFLEDPVVYPSVQGTAWILRPHPVKGSDKPDFSHVWPMGDVLWAQGLEASEEEALGTVS